MKKIFFGLAVLFSALGLFAESDSIDGLVSVAKKGEFPSGFFCKLSGYMPGDSVSVTNPANGVTLQILNLGTLEAGSDCVIVLSPEAASKLGAKKNMQISISNRSGRYDENVSGSAVLTKGGLSSKKKKSAKTVDESVNKDAENEPVAAFDAPVTEDKSEEIKIAEEPKIVEETKIPEEPKIVEKEPVAVFEKTEPVSPAEEKFVDDTVISSIEESETVPVEETAPAAIIIEEEVAEKAVPVVEEEIMTGKTVPVVEEEVMAGKTVPTVEEELVPEKPKSSKSRNKIEKMELVPTTGVVPPKSKKNSPDTAKKVVEKEPVAKISNPAPVKKPVIIEEEIVEPKKPEPKKTAPAKKSEKIEPLKSVRTYDNEDQLPKNNYYIQIATLGSSENVNRNINKYGKYPFVVVSTPKGAYKLLVGPLSVDEYGSVLEKFKSFGFKDAFVKHK